MKKKTNKTSKNIDFEVNDFRIGDNEIAAELSDVAKRKVLATHELDKLIDQSGAADSYFVNHKKKLIFAHSPHLLDLQGNKLSPKTKDAIVVNKSKAKRSLSGLIPSIKTKSKIREIKYWQPPKFSWQFPNIFKLSVVQLLLSMFRFLLLAITGLKFVFDLLVSFIKRIVFVLFYTSRRGVRIVGKTSALQYSRSVLGFIIVAVLLMLPYFGVHMYGSAKTMQGHVLGISQEAVESWKQGFDSMKRGEWDQAVDSFSKASIDFSSAQQMLNAYSDTLDKFPDWLNIDATEMGSGINIVAIGQSMSDISIKLNEIIALSSSKTASLADKLSILSANISDINSLYSDVASKVAMLNLDIIPNEYRPIATIWKSQSQNIAKYLNELDNNLDWILQLIGTDSPQRYILVFQNSNEMRATGGFMGSFALLDMDKGEIEELSIPGGGLYDLGGQMQDFVVAPYPHQLLSTRWQIWDANWWSDWPTTAKKIAQFYESAGGPSVDGVIAVNSHLIVDLVGYFEPITMENYDKQLTSSNVVTALQHAVEFEYDIEENRPKQILSDLAPILLDRIYDLPSVELFEVASLLYNNLSREDIQMYLFDNDMQEKIVSKSWSGQIPNVVSDYLQVVVQNIGGGKSDEAISQTVDYNLMVGPDDYLIATANIIREHNGDTEDVFTGHRNVAFIRILTPAGSDLISVTGAIEPDKRLFKEVPDYLEADEDLIALDGINYYKEFDKYYSTTQFNKQVFGQWLIVDPGEKEELKFVYRLPIKITKDKSGSGIRSWLMPNKQKLNYSLYYDKQSGINSQNFRFSFTAPKKLDAQWFSDSGGAMYKIGKNLYAESVIESDYQLGFILR
jgi:Protein of unknown function (DUF4012)